MVPEEFQFDTVMFVVFLLAIDIYMAAGREGSIFTNRFIIDFAPAVHSAPSVAAMSGHPACPGQAWVIRDGRCHVSAVSAQWQASQALTPLHFWSMTINGVRVWCHGATLSML